MLFKKKRGVLASFFIFLFVVCGAFSAGITDTATASSDPSQTRYLIPGGNVIGVKLYTKGVHVISTTYVDTADGRMYPGRNAGIREGDFIVRIDGYEIEDTEAFETHLQKQGDCTLTVQRGEESFETTITPVYCEQDGMYRVGIWVRDSTAGIGTVTFYDPESGKFGALGHGITDADTKQLLPVSKGGIYNAYLTSVKKGERGNPGELNGIFTDPDSRAGELQKNTQDGIFGSYDPQKLAERIDMTKMVPVGSADTVREGEASIYCSIDKDEVRSYRIEIVKIIRSNLFSSKGMILKVTDPKLLERTNGIVQGMSGSPILQDGKLIGAVTHVFVGDPSRGYGVFLDDMLSQITGA